MRTIAAVLAVAACISSALAGGLVTVTENVDGAAGQPGPVNLRRTSPIWSDARITGRTLWRGTTAAGRTAVFTDVAIGGNASAKASLVATAQQPPDSFAFGLRAELFTHEAPQRRARFTASLAAPASVSAEYYISGSGELWTFEPVSLATGFVLDRVLMGELCWEPGGCPWANANFGDPLPMLALSVENCPECVPFTPYLPLHYIDSAPAGSAPGDAPFHPVGAWFRLAHEVSADGMLRLRIDFLDGQGSFLIRDGLAFLPPQDLVPDGFAANGGFTNVNSPLFIDNLVFSGELAICDGDANGDGVVDFSDLNIALGQFSIGGPGLGGDFDGDQQVNFADLNILLGRFNTACE